MREALFSILAADVPGARVLDLYAGSGALGIEALSRGAAHATFVERDARAVSAIIHNLATIGLAGRASVRRVDAAAFTDPGVFDLVLVDPPYAQPLPAVYGIVGRLRLAPGARVVVERDRRDPDLDTPPPPVLAHVARRAYGDTVLLLLSASECAT